MLKLPTEHFSLPPNQTEVFLLLKENRFAYTAMNRLHRQRSRTANPLVYIYGPSGLGKSHVTRQFIRDERLSNPTLRLEHVTASEFAAQLAKASCNHSIDEFQRQYRDLDILVCEDLSALENRHESQRQLIVVLDELLHSGGRCLLTCRKSPGELTNVLPRLINRCQAGVCAPMTTLSRRSRASLICHFAQTHQILIPMNVVALLADELPVSPRELLATVRQLEACARLRKTGINSDFAKRYLEGEVKPRQATLAQIAKAVARHFGVRVSDIRGHTRLQRLPRQCAMFLSHELTNNSLTKIAAFFGRRNHSTAAHAYHRVHQLMLDEPTLRQHLTQLRLSLGTTQEEARA